MRTAKVTGLIPARYGSSRLPGKPLKMIGGKSMIQRVYERCAQATLLDDVVVATDDERIISAVEAFGGNAVMTRVDHLSGTDRLAEAAGKTDADIIVNIQGDQPFLDPKMIEEGVQPLLDDASLEIATLMVPITREADLEDPAVVKVVPNLAGDAMYFSRSRIPYPREAFEHNVYEHVGLYVYKTETLIKVSQLAPTVLEQVEMLEQLRWIEHGIRIGVVESHCANVAINGFSVDTPEDLARAEEILEEYGLE